MSWHSSCARRARRAQHRRRRATHRGRPVLAVEVLSPSTRHIDLGLKLSRYEAASTPAYWVIDPDEPSLRAWELREGRYEQVARVSGETAATLSFSWPLRIVPDHLIRPDDRPSVDSS
ncbi:Uma2 family endonuclease [Ornithinimicrobium sp. F0845]|uniref:Uma2 family endonuclease n=1 Tax=Ornithinimicrobium sp. F0845 TaxID=2926412 RepID=UPI0032B145A0